MFFVEWTVRYFAGVELKMTFGELSMGINFKNIF